MVREAGERSQDEVESVEQLDEAILFCKARAVHQMAIQELREQTWGDEVDWVCEVCGCERYDSYDPNGELLSRYYKHPRRYKIVGEALFRADYRTELFRRMKKGEAKIARPKTRLILVTGQEVKPEVRRRGRG